MLAVVDEINALSRCRRFYCSSRRLLGAAAQSADKKLLHATLARDKNGEPTTTFRSDSAKIYTYWEGNTLKAGDKIRAVWIAEGIGYTALKRRQDHGGFRHGLQAGR